MPAELQHRARVHETKTIATCHAQKAVTSQVAIRSHCSASPASSGTGVVLIHRVSILVPVHGVLDLQMQGGEPNI